MKMMTSKERVHATLEGRPVDRAPVTVLYNQLYHLDHFAALTDRPQWEVYRWPYMEPEEHLALYRLMVERAPFEFLQPQSAPSRAQRERTAFEVRDGQPYRLDRITGARTPIGDTRSHHATDYQANERQYVFDRADADAQIKVVRAEEQLARGTNDFVEAAVEAFGREQFILSGGVIGTLYSCHPYVGLTNLFAMLIQQPELIDYMCHKVLEQNIETIRALATAGGDAIYIDDATATSDMISVNHFERFSLPYMQEMVREIHRLGQKAIIIYFGGVADRLEQLAAIGADGLLFETSMKGYVNDLGQIAERIGDRVSLFGNMDPVGVLQDGTDAEVQADIRRQLAAGRKARGFILSTASPITPATPLRRVQQFLAWGREYGFTAAR
jgi:uroporphyrinogen-III decarboxylase